MELAIYDRERLLAEVFGSVFRARGHVVHIAGTVAELADLVTGQPLDACLVNVDAATASAVAQLPALAAAGGCSPRFVAYVSSGDNAARAVLTTTAGIDKVLFKTASLDTVVTSVEAQVKARAGARRTRPRKAGRPADGELTSREREVLVALSRGASTGTIAHQMEISAATTRSHVQSLLRKLGAHSRLEAVAIAVDAGLLAHAPARTGPALIWRLPPPAPASATAS